MILPRTGFVGFHLVPPPPDGFWRVTSWHDPLDPPPPPPHIGEIGAEEDESGRFDAPAGEYRILYCATAPEGALGERLAAFAPAVPAMQRIEDYLDSEPDPEFADDYLYEGVTAEDVESFNWKLVHAPSDASARFIDVWHPSTGLAILPRALPLLRIYRLWMMDRRALADERRGFTRRLAGLFWDEASSGDGRPAADGLRYESRLTPGWECWGLWEPLALHPADAQVQQVFIDTPALRRAAELLGVWLRTSPP